ncbi:MAG: imidazole glycerol phosphate synthase subunit HisH [Candidatus Omnitrophota bacterium]
MIAIIDYGMGNLRSVLKAFEHIASKAFVTSSPSRILKADKIVLPGVGAFGDAIEELTRKGLYDAIIEAIGRGKPFFGICLGMQLLVSQSQESPHAKGLRVLKGEVVKFIPTTKLKVPHIGWNQVELVKKSLLFKGLKNREYFYFAHSFYVKPKERNAVSGITNYGVRFTSCIEKENIFGVQFHPEKSQKAGLVVLKNFSKI